MEQPYLSAMRYSSLILTEVAWTPDELLRFIDSKYIPTLFFKLELSNNL